MTCTLCTLSLQIAIATSSTSGQMTVWVGESREMVRNCTSSCWPLLQPGARASRRSARIPGLNFVREPWATNRIRRHGSWLSIRELWCRLLAWGKCVGHKCARCTCNARLWTYQHFSVSPVHMMEAMAYSASLGLHSLLKPMLIPFHHSSLLYLCCYTSLRIPSLLSVTLPFSLHWMSLFHPCSSHFPFQSCLFLLWAPFHTTHHMSPISPHPPFPPPEIPSLLILCSMQHMAVPQRNCRSCGWRGCQSWLPAHRLCTHLWKWGWDRTSLAEALSGGGCQAWGSLHNI